MPWPSERADSAQETWFTRHTELFVDRDQPDRRTFLVLVAGPSVGMATEWAPSNLNIWPVAT